MATEYSIQKMVSDGTLSTITLGIQYLQRNDIYMRIAGEETPQSGAPSGYTWYFVDNTTLKILPVVPNGVEVVVYRRTDVDAMYNIYSQNAQFDEATIDENNQQLLYIAQEYLEQGIPGAGVDTLEFIRDDGTYTYYRIKRTDGSYSDEFAVPSAGSATKIIAREALRRSYAEAGYGLLGTFRLGVTLNTLTDAILDEPTGIVYSWDGSFPKVVPAGSTPETTGGVIAGAWRPRTDAVLRTQLSYANGADIVNGADKVIRVSQRITPPYIGIDAQLNALGAEADASGLKLVCDIPSAIINGVVTLPRRFDGAGCIFSGTGSLLVTAQKFANIKDFKCPALRLSGIWNSDIAEIEVLGAFTVDGLTGDWGTFWNDFTNIRAGQIILDVRYQAVNSNTFNTCLGVSPGVAGLLITEGGVASSPTDGIMEAHNNRFIGCDFSHSLGPRNEVLVRNQTNHLIGCYMEHGAIPVGNWNIRGATIDGNLLPAVGPMNYVTELTDQNPAAFGDSIPLSVNIAAGGDWSARGVGGKPACLSASFAAAVTAVPDTPWGYTATYGGTTSATFQYIDISFKSPTGMFSSVIWIYSPLGTTFANVSVIDTVMAESFRDTAMFNAGGAFYLMRISGICTKNAVTKIRLYLTTGTAVSKTMYVGAAHVSATKAASFPMLPEPAPSSVITVNGCQIMKGIQGIGYQSGASFFNLTVTFPEPFRGGITPLPFLTFKPVVGYEDKYIKHILLSVSGTNAIFRVYYSVDWAGDVYWQAIGM